MARRAWSTARSASCTWPVNRPTSPSVLAIASRRFLSSEAGGAASAISSRVSARLTRRKMTNAPQCGHGMPGSTVPGGSAARACRATTSSPASRSAVASACCKVSLRASTAAASAARRVALRARYRGGGDRLVVVAFGERQGGEQVVFLWFLKFELPAGRDPRRAGAAAPIRPGDLAPSALVFGALVLAQHPGAVPALRLDQFPDRLDGASAELDLGEGFGKVLSCRIGVQIFAENARAIRGRFRDDAVEPRCPDRRGRRLALCRGLTSGPFDPRHSRFALDHDPRALGAGFDQQSRRSFRRPANGKTAPHNTAPVACARLDLPAAFLPATRAIGSHSMSARSQPR